MTKNNGTAEIYDMEDARRRMSDAPGAQFRDAGEWLSSVRNASGLALSEVASKTHIKESHLQAIEAMDREALPARPYAIGFVRAYAEFLELDASLVVERFKDDTGAAVAQPVEAEKSEKPEPPDATEKPELSLLAVVAIIAFILWCAWQITLPREVRQLGRDVGVETASPAPSAPAVVPAPAANVVEAELIERIDPIYPMGCLNDAAATESVVISLTVTAQGRVAGERVAGASNACFSETALIAVRRWKFSPRTVDGVRKAAHDQRFELVFERPL